MSRGAIKSHVIDAPVVDSLAFLSADPGPERSGVDVHELRAPVIAHATALRREREIAQPLDADALESHVHRATLHVQRVLRDAAAGDGGQLRVALGRAVAGDD